MKKVLILALCVFGSVYSAENDEKISQSSLHVVEELTGLIFSYRPSINQLESLIITILDFANIISDNNNQSIDSKKDLEDLQNKLRKCLFKIRSFDAKKRKTNITEKASETKEASTNTEEIDPSQALHEQEKKLMVAGFKEILSALFGMMLNPSGMALYTEKLVSGVLKILSSILADGKIDTHDLDNMQSAIKDVILFK